MYSSVVERCPDKTEVLGSIPSTRTIYYLFLFSDSLAFKRQRSLSARMNPFGRGSIPSTRTIYYLFLFSDSLAFNAKKFKKFNRPNDQAKEKR